MYRLHIANKNYSSWSLRPWILMHELGIPFEERLSRFTEGGRGLQFQSFSPNGKVPCLIDGETTVWESLAIVEYLAERHPAVWPAEPVARAWARSAAAEMHAGFATLRERCSMSVGMRVEIDQAEPALVHDLTRLQELWRDGLDRFGGKFLAGDAFTAVDAFFTPVAFRVRTYGLKLGVAASTYVELLLGLPGMVAWNDAALAETFRHVEHEKDILASGRAKLLQDLRAPAA